MDHLHLQLLRDMAEWARRHGERVALDHSVLTALLDEIDDWSVIAAERAVKIEALGAVEPLAGVRVNTPEPTDVVCTCGKTFMTKHALNVHIARSADHAWEREQPEAPPEPPAIVCPICGADHFKDVRGLGGHIWGKHHIRASEMKAE